ncbi:hypothetical protein [Bacillus sp. T3]|uniref:hypothetical protein n=1 Tax=Bacillus sp. T3 TaxID=467262 RepID=UPI002981BD30|nr:hypothetical protein [Bacillus sp. T3]
MNSVNTEVIIQNSIFEVVENIGYGAAVYILSAQKFELLNCMILALNNTINTPLIKVGPYGSPKPTKIFGATFKENMIYTKTPISGIDTSNAGTDAPPYLVEGNTLFNAKLNITVKDININNNLISN